MTPLKAYTLAVLSVLADCVATLIGLHYQVAGEANPIAGILYPYTGLVGAVLVLTLAGIIWAAIPLSLIRWAKTVMGSRFVQWCLVLYLALWIPPHVYYVAQWVRLLI